MKTSLLLASLFLTSMVQAGNSPGLIPSESYGKERYAKLFSNSPFDFPRTEAPPPPAPPVMPDWALAGLTKATDFLIVNLVNLKTNERLRLFRSETTPSSKANRAKMGGDIYQLEALNFADGKPHTVQTATALVSKNGESARISFDAKVYQKAPAKNPAEALPNTTRRVAIPTDAVPPKIITR